MKNSDLVRRIALGRIGRLAALAEARTADKTPESTKLAKRYVSLARRLGTHYKVSLPAELRNKICKKCGNFLVPGINCSVRLASSHGYAAYVCECGEEKHVFYKRRGSFGATR